MSTLLKDTLTLICINVVFLVKYYLVYLTAQMVGYVCISIPLMYMIKLQAINLLNVLVKEEQSGTLSDIITLDTTVKQSAFAIKHFELKVAKNGFYFH